MDAIEEEKSKTDLKALLDAECDSVALEADDATAVTGNQQTDDQNVTIAGEDSESTSTVRKVETETAKHQVGTSTPAASFNDQEEPAHIGSFATVDGELKKNVGDTKTSSFAKLVKTWETYISDAQRAENFQPMQMLQNLRLCGTGHDIGRLTLAPSTEFTTNAEGQDPFEPIILRHTHSTPLQYRPSFFNDYDNGAMPPPSQLDPTRRSSSTPSRGSAFQTFSGRSAFERHLHSTSNLSSGDSVSAFGFPLHRSSYSGVSTESNIRSSAFDPVPFVPATSTVQEEPQEENTSIEVMDLGRSEPAFTEEQGEVEVEIADETDSYQHGAEQSRPKKSAAARAARFLSDVGVLRRKKKGVRGSVVSSTASMDTSLIQRQETTDTTRSTDEAKDASGGPSDPVGDSHVTLNRSQGSESDNSTRSKNSQEVPAEPYHQLESDADEEYLRFHCIGNSAQNMAESPPTITYPGYQRMVDDRPSASGSWEQCSDQQGSEHTRPAVRIQVSCNAPTLPQITEQESFQAVDASSPRQGHMIHGENGNQSPDSGSNSPGTNGSSATISTSGHTTQATSTTSTSGNTSRISETDREVMEAIKEGKRRRRRMTDPGNDKHDSDGTIDSSSTGSTTNGYMALPGSPALRDGASVVADRFFKNSRSPVPHGGYPSCSSNTGSVTAYFPNAQMSTSVRAQTSSTSRKNTNNGSPTSTSLQSLDENPPRFVSYLDRQNASDLTSLREATEASSCRAEVEEREDSPAEIVGYPAVIFEEAKTVGDEENENDMSVLPKLVLPSKERLYSMLDRFRSRPPRSPATGMRTRTPTTPPPRLGSPAYHHQVSPPRNIVDHRIDSNVSRPYVIRTNPSTQKLVVLSPGSPMGRPGSPLVCVPVGSPHYRPNTSRPLSPWQEQASPYFNNTLRTGTYEERSIEIMKTESKDELFSQRLASPSPHNNASAF